MNQLEILLAGVDQYPLLKTVMTLAVAIIAAFITNFIIERVFRSVFKKTSTELDDKVLNATKTPIFWSVLFGIIYWKLGHTPYLDSYAVYTKNVMVTLGVLLWARASIKVVEYIFEELDKRTDHIDDMIPFLTTTSKIVAVTIFFLMLLSYWNIDIRPALASAGVAGVAIAFAAKDTVANLFGGISVFFDKPYKSGDYIIVENLYRGQVTEIGIRSTKIKTNDNVLLSVPNSVMVTNAVINETGFDPKLRLRIPLGIAYNTDLEKAEKVILQTLRSHKEIFNDPEPLVRYRNFGDSAIELEILGVISSPEIKGKVTHDLIKRLKQNLDANSIEIPFPQRDIHMKRSD